MKKIIYSFLFLGLAPIAYGNSDFLFEEIVIPSSVQVPKVIKVEENNFPQIIQQSDANFENVEQLIMPKFVSSNIYEPIMNMLGKFKNEIKIIYTDFDGIIVPLDYSNVIINDNIYKSISKLKDNNIPVIFTTGRTYREAKRLANVLDLEPDFFITQNGAEIVDSNGVLIYDESLDLKLRNKLNHEVKWFNMIYNQDLKIAFYINGDVYVYRNSNIPNLIDVPTEIDLYSQLPKERVSKIRVYAKDTNSLDLFKKYLKRTYPKLNIVNTSENVIDIMAENATKSKAVMHLSKDLNIDLSNSAAFGTYEAEVDLMNTIRTNGGLAISSEGAIQKVKDESSYITKDIENNGFSFAIDTILGNNSILESDI